MNATMRDKEDKFVASNRRDKDNKFIAYMDTFIHSFSPNRIYSRSKANQRRKRRLKKKVQPELFKLWSNCSDIVSPPTISSPSCSYPSVNWSAVNKRFVNNIPLPTPQPCHSCSEDPQFYKTVFERTDYGYHWNMG